jgi:hypothetical protein
VVDEEVEREAASDEAQTGSALCLTHESLAREDGSFYYSTTRMAALWSMAHKSLIFDEVPFVDWQG